MPTSFSHDNDDSANGPQTWLIVPPLGNSLERKLKRILPRISGSLARSHVLVHRTSRLESPPRLIEIELLSLAIDDENMIARQIHLTNGEHRDWENLCTGLTAISSELADRWPEGARPDSIALITDGRSLWFNPGKPQGENIEWLTFHLSGKSPCAMIYSTIDAKPMTASWFEV